MSANRPSKHGLRTVLHASGTLAFVLLAGTGPAWAQAGGGPISPAVTPPDVRVGNLRAQLQAYQPTTVARGIGPAWLVTPSIGVDVGATDNALLVERPRRADVFTIISPSISISGDTARLKVNATYAPQFSLYASSSSQTRVDQFFGGNALATIVPDIVFLDVRGSISQQSRTGGFARTETQSLNRQDQIQTISLSATPYAEQRFGGWGTGRVGYSIAQTFQNARDGDDRFNQVSNRNFNQGLDQNNQLSSQFATGDLTTHRQRASFVTGENLGRINNISVLEAVQYDGFGPYRGAYRNIATTDFGYALSRTVTLLAGTGYQDLRFSGPQGTRIKEPIWNVGVRLLPNQDSSITVGYGRRDGANSAYLDAAYSPTARTRVFARYGTGITTDSEEQQNLLQSSTLSSTGLLQDSTTGSPVGSNSGFFGTQNGLFRSRRFSVTGLLLLNRDSISVSVVNEERTNLSDTLFDPTFNSFSNSNANLVVLPAGSTSNSTSGVVSWQHELTPRLTSTASFQYGVQDFGQSGQNAQNSSTTSISGIAGLGYQFNPTLFGSAQYRYTERTGGFGRSVFNNSDPSNSNGPVVENSVLVGLRKSF